MSPPDEASGPARPTQTEWPRISVVTPSFNQAEFLEHTIRSVLSQGYPNLEYIIIDGGSTDRSLEIIRRYRDCLAYWCSEPDSGQYEAIEKGFQRATGEILAWINSDDIYCPWTFATVASIMRDCPEVEWLTSQSPVAVDRLGHPFMVGAIKGFAPDALLEGRHNSTKRHRVGFLGFIPQESTFWRRHLWVRAGGRIPSGYANAGDFALWAKFFAHAELFAVAAPLGCYRRQDGQKTADFARYAAETHEVLTRLKAHTKAKSGKMARALVYSIRFNDIPGIRRVCRALMGYRGGFVLRQHPDLRSGRWKAERRRFI